ncbi:MAG: trigger factor [Alphaproteobacteria bacterium]|jgi:trigger factor|nr:trigger factor [Alphaproteobacteria bacterium]
MQVTELSADGLKRQYKVVVPAAELEERVNGKLEEIKQTVRMPGFRPGKVPLGLLKKQYGRSVLGEIVEQSVNEGSQKAIADHELKPALKPQIEVTSFDEGRDLEFQMDVEVLPPVPEVDLKSLEIEKPVAKVGDDELQRALDDFRRQHAAYAAPETPRPARDGDRVTIDFVGKIDGEPFEGGSAEGFQLELGRGRMIPGFEEQLEGVQVGDTPTLEIPFPESYGKAELAGRTATFDVEVKAVEEPELPDLDDGFAESIGFADAAELTEAFRSRLQERYDQASRFKAKRALLDKLAETYVFEVPKGMVDLEFDAIWKQLTDEMERLGQTFEDSGKTEEETKAEYRGIAERRVRLGLLLSEIGNANDVQVTPEELARAVADQARRYPGQEKEVFEFFQQNAEAREQLRAPVFEDKVIDFILQIAPVTTKEVSTEELMRDPEEDAAGADAATTT